MEAGWVSLTFDDALDQHLDCVVPALNEALLQGTFYTHLSSTSFINRQDEWRQAARDGHELGNHTVFHPADARKSWVQPGNAIDFYSLSRMSMELEFANAVLHELDSQTERTFAYPCSNTFVGRRGWVRRLVEQVGLGQTRVAGCVDRWKLDLGSSLQSYEPLVGHLCRAGRGGGLQPGEMSPPTTTWKRTMLPSIAVVNSSLQELQRHVIHAVEAKTWSILQFHGVGGGHHMDCDKSVFLEFVNWLKADHSYRVITVIDGARRLWPNAVRSPEASHDCPDINVCSIHPPTPHYSTSC